jgi:hypothetical protein
LGEKFVEKRRRNIKGELLVMKTWLKRNLVVVISILTLGFISPSHSLWTDQNDHDKDSKRQKSEVQHERSESIQLTESESHDRIQYVSELLQEAEAQVYTKFGPRIKRKIEEEFHQMIWPNMEEVILSFTNALSDEELFSLRISNTPGRGESEKIFHLYDDKTSEDRLRIHVRREHPPLDGYYFHFHYHTYKDGFTEHFSLGKIYWDRNTPPHWMSA